MKMIPSDSLFILHGRDGLYEIKGKKLTHQELDKFLALMPNASYFIWEEGVLKELLTTISDGTNE